MTNLSFLLAPLSSNAGMVASSADDGVSTADGTSTFEDGIGCCIEGVTATGALVTGAVVVVGLVGVGGAVVAVVVTIGTGTGKEDDASSGLLAKASYLLLTLGTTPIIITSGSSSLKTGDSGVTGRLISFLTLSVLTAGKPGGGFITKLLIAAVDIGSSVDVDGYVAGVDEVAGRVDVDAKTVVKADDEEAD